MFSWKQKEDAIPTIEPIYLELMGKLLLNLVGGYDKNFVLQSQLRELSVVPCFDLLGAKSSVL